MTKKKKDANSCSQKQTKPPVATPNASNSPPVSPNRYSSLHSVRDHQGRFKSPPLPPAVLNVRKAAIRPKRAPNFVRHVTICPIADPVARQKDIEEWARYDERVLKEQREEEIQRIKREREKVGQNVLEAPALNQGCGGGSDLTPALPKILPQSQHHVIPNDDQKPDIAASAAIRPKRARNFVRHVTIIPIADPVARQKDFEEWECYHERVLKEQREEEMQRIKREREKACQNVLEVPALNQGSSEGGSDSAHALPKIPLPPEPHLIPKDDQKPDITAIISGKLPVKFLGHVKEEAHSPPPPVLQMPVASKAAIAVANIDAKAPVTYSHYNLRSHPKPLEKQHYVYSKNWAMLQKITRESMARRPKIVPKTEIEDCPPYSSGSGISSEFDVKPAVANIKIECPSPPQNEGATTAACPSPVSSGNTSLNNSKGLGGSPPYSSGGSIFPKVDVEAVIATIKTECPSPNENEGATPAACPPPVVASASGTSSTVTSQDLGVASPPKSSPNKKSKTKKSKESQDPHPISGSIQKKTKKKATTEPKPTVFKATCLEPSSPRSSPSKKSKTKKSKEYHLISVSIQKKKKKEQQQKTPVEPSETTFLDPASLFLNEATPKPETDFEGKPLFKVPLLPKRNEEGADEKKKPEKQPKKPRKPRKKKDPKPEDEDLSKEKLRELLDSVNERPGLTDQQGPNEEKKKPAKPKTPRKKDPKPWDEEMSEEKLQEMLYNVNKHPNLTDQQKATWLKNTVEDSYRLGDVCVLDYKKTFGRIYHKVTNTADGHTKHVFSTFESGAEGSIGSSNRRPKKLVPKRTVVHRCPHGLMTSSTNCCQHPQFVRQPLQNPQNHPHRSGVLQNPQQPRQQLLKQRPPQAPGIHPQSSGIHPQSSGIQQQSHQHLLNRQQRSLATSGIHIRRNHNQRRHLVPCGDPRLHAGQQRSQPLVYRSITNSSGVATSSQEIGLVVPPLQFDAFGMPQQTRDWAPQGNPMNPFVAGPSNGYNLNAQQQKLLEERNTSPLFIYSTSSQPATSGTSSFTTPAAPPNPPIPPIFNPKDEEEILNNTVPFLEDFLNPDDVAKVLEGDMDVDEVCQLLGDTPLFPVEPSDPMELCYSSAEEEEEDRAIIKDAMIAEADPAFVEADQEMDRYVEDLKNMDDDKVVNEVIKEMTGNDFDVEEFHRCFKKFNDSADLLEDKEESARITKDKLGVVVQQVQKLSEQLDPSVDALEVDVQKQKFLLARAEGRRYDPEEEKEKKRKKKE